MATCFGKCNERKDSHALVDQQGNRKVHLTTALFSEEERGVSIRISVEDLNSVYVVVDERVGSTFFSWKKACLCLENGYLLCYKMNNRAACRMLPLHLCMVRPSSSRKKGMFKVVCATKFNLKFKAASHDAMREIVAAIQMGIAKALSTYNEPKNMEKTGKDLLTALYRVNPLNKICADCCAKDPTWVSISIGALLCIECAGVHRSLGTHISKIRSFELDKWDEKIEMVEKIDNADINSVFEFHISQGFQKPTILSDRESRERYITAKYVQKSFMKKHFRKSELPAIIVTEICNKFKPTVHIGSDVFAKKTPYGPDSIPLGRKLSLGNDMFGKMASPVRRASIAPSGLRKNALSPLPPRRGSAASIDRPPVSGRRGSLLPTALRRSSLVPSPKTQGPKLEKSPLVSHRALFPPPMVAVRAV